MRTIWIAALALTGALLAASPASAFYDDTHYWGPPVHPVPHAYGYSYARARCGHYWASPWIVKPRCASRTVRRAKTRHLK